MSQSPRTARRANLTRDLDTLSRDDLDARLQDLENEITDLEAQIADAKGAARKALQAESDRLTDALDRGTELLAALDKSPAKATARAKSVTPPKRTPPKTTKPRAGSMSGSDDDTVKPRTRPPKSKLAKAGTEIKQGSVNKLLATSDTLQKVSDNKISVAAFLYSEKPGKDREEYDENDPEGAANFKRELKRDLYANYKVPFHPEGKKSKSGKVIGWKLEFHQELDRAERELRRLKRKYGEDASFKVKGYDRVSKSVLATITLAKKKVFDTVKHINKADKLRDPDAKTVGIKGKKAVLTDDGRQWLLDEIADGTLVAQNWAAYQSKYKAQGITTNSLDKYADLTNGYAAREGFITGNALANLVRLALKPNKANYPSTTKIRKNGTAQSVAYWKYTKAMKKLLASEYSPGVTYLEALKSNIKNKNAPKINEGLEIGQITTFAKLLYMNEEEEDAELAKAKDTDPISQWLSDAYKQKGGRLTTVQNEVIEEAAKIRKFGSVDRTVTNTTDEAKDARKAKADAAKEQKRAETAAKTKRPGRGA